MASIRGCWAWSPTWPISNWSQGHNVSATPSNFGAGVTFVTSPAPPWAGVLGEKWMRLDANDATSHAAQGFNVQPPQRDLTIANPPGHTLRWAQCAQFPFRHGAALGNGDADPASDALLWISNPGGVIETKLMYKSGASARKLELIVGGVSLGVASAALSTLTNYVIEVWCVWNYSNGTDRGSTNRLWVVRSMTPTGGAVTTLINAVNTSNAGQISMDAEMRLGETAQRGANFWWFALPPTLAWEDADDPYGIRRIDQMLPNSVAGVIYSEWTNPNPANINESGAAVPGSAAYDTVGFIGPATMRQYYKLTSPSYIVAADAVLGVLQSTYRASDTPKTGVMELHGALSDGTNISELASWGGAAVYALGQYSLNPAGGPWTPGDLSTLQSGMRAYSTDNTVVRNFWDYTMTLFIPYRKAGETTAVVPGSGSPGPTVTRPPGGRLYAEIYDAAGNKLGAGPIFEIVSATITDRLDAGGDFSLLLPDADERAALTSQGREVRLYREGEGLIFRGLIEDREWRVID